MDTKKSFLALMAAIILWSPFVPASAAGVPESVTGVIATAVDPATVNLTWSPALDEEGQAVKNYRIYYGTQSVLNGDAPEYETLVDTADNTTSYVVTSLTANTTYYFAVTAISTDNVESEEYSWETNAKTPAQEVVESEMTEEGDTTSPTVLSAVAVDKTHTKVVFSEAVTLPAENAQTAFGIVEELTDEPLDVVSATLDAEDETNATVVLETAAQTVGVSYVVTAGIQVTDTAGNPIVSGFTDTALFAGSDVEPAAMHEAGDVTIEEITALEEPLPPTPLEITPVADTTAPEDVTNLVLTFRNQLDELFTVLMDWTPSLNSAKDLVDQILYMSMDRGTTYDTGKSLGAIAAHAEVPNLEGGKEYTFKITTKDASGNESVGAIKAIRLPQSGPAVLALMATSLAGAHLALRRRK